MSTPALMRDFSPQMGRGVAMGFWALGPDHGRALRQPGGDAHARPPRALAGPVHHLGHRVHVRGGDLLLLPPRTLAAVTRPADGHREGARPRRSTGDGHRRRGGDDAPAPLHAAARPHLLVDRDLGLLALLLRVGQRAHHLLGGTFNRTTPQANGINVWLAASSPCGLVVGRRAVGLGQGAKAVHALRRGRAPW